jgi:hypothetical protein
MRFANHNVELGIGAALVSDKLVSYFQMVGEQCNLHLAKRGSKRETLDTSPFREFRCE